MRDVDALSRVPTGAAVAEEGARWVVDTWLEEPEKEPVQKEDDEVRLIRAIRNGAAYTKLEAVPTAFHAINSYKSRDPTCSNFVEGEDGRLYHVETFHDEVVRQLYVPLEMRGRLVIAKHGSAAGGHRSAVETLAKLRKLYFWATMSKDVHEWIAGCGCARKKGERARRVGKLEAGRESHL